MDIRRELVLGKRRFDPRNEVIAIGLIIGMLELAAAALGKVTAWRHLVMFSRRQRAVIEQRITRYAERHVVAAGSDSFTAGCDPDDQLVHNAAIAAGIASARLSAIISGPANSAARP